MLELIFERTHDPHVRVARPLAAAALAHLEHGIDL
jgi:hypothetical protein